MNYTRKEVEGILARVWDNGNFNGNKQEFIDFYKRVKETEKVVETNSGKEF